MIKGHRRGARVIRLKSFRTAEYGNWSIKLSMTDMHSYMISCQNLTNQENAFVRFFVDEASVVSFVDFLKHNDHYNELDL